MLRVSSPENLYGGSKMKSKEYESYDEKIKVLKEILGGWPPPFDPPWCVQMSQGRCGSNGLMEVVGSFFDGNVTYDPLYTKLDEIPLESQDYWKPSMGKQYLYYNFHSLVPHELQGLVCLWLLENSPKVVYLRRNDHLTRAISLFYASIIWEFERKMGKNLDRQHPAFLKAHQTPICFEKIDAHVTSSIIIDMCFKKIIDTFVSPDRLLEVSHFDIFYAGTETLQGLIRFLECDPTKNVETKFGKQTNPLNIPNRQEVIERYGRELAEMPNWVPDDLDKGFIEQEVERLYTRFLELNLNKKKDLRSESSSHRGRISMFKGQESHPFEEKIDEIRKYLGEFPPPFDPPWCIQVSTARCGSNALREMVRSFLHEDAVVGAPNYEMMEIEGPEANWVPDPGKKYLYYNIFDFDPHKLHFPIFIWMLQHCPKVVFLSREDHFTRTLSLYYADIIHDRFSRDGKDVKRANFYPEIFSKPVDIDHFNRLLHSSLVNIEWLKRIVKTFVNEARLHEIKFSDLYHHKTLDTLSELVDFLEQDRNEVTVEARVQRETLHDRIPNLDELLDTFHRGNISEQEYWIPENIEINSIHAEVDTVIEEFVRLNMPQKTPQITKPASGRNFHFNLDPSLQFYINEIPKSATYLRNDEFVELPDMCENIYLLDSRWKDITVAVDSHINEFFEVTDIHSNRSRQYKWVCGLSAFFLKFLTPAQGEHNHRIQPKTHNKLIEGVRTMIAYKDRCPETLLRFYVSAEVWERLAQENLLNTEDTEFYKMAYPSEDSQLGTIWRMLALFDKEFEWAIETDIAPDEGWIFARIAHWDRPMLYNWVEKNAAHTYTWAGEYLIYEGNYSEKQNLFCGSSRHCDPGPFDYMSGGGIVTRPERMPSPESVIHRYIMERPLSLTYYHAGADVWSEFLCYESQIPLGWEGWGCDQSVWGRLKKAMPVRHILHDQSLEWMRKVNPVIPSSHLLRRLISQLHAEGNEFVHWKTLEPIFNLQE